jgi:predicted RNase H-like HicB family nuclease
MQRYTVILYPEGEEEGYFALVPTLPECESHGATRDEALANARDAIVRRVADLKAAGAYVPVEADEPWAVTVEVPD